MEVDKKKSYVCVGGVLYFIFTYSIVYSVLESGAWFDYYFHMTESTWANILNGKLTYPVWHICYLMICSIASNAIASSVATAIFNGFTYIVTVNILYRFMDGDELFANVIGFFLLICGPLDIPFFNTSYYLGQLTSNTWHNPTNMCVKGIGLLATWLFYCCISGQAKPYTYIFCSIALAASIYFKPSYAQFALPGAFLVILIFILLHGAEYKKTLFHSSLCLVPAMLLLIIEFVRVFLQGTSNAGNAGISPFLVWKIYSPNIVISALLSWAFPLLVIVFRRKKWFSNSRNIVFGTFFVVAFIEYVLLVEKGRESHVNFGWGLLLVTFYIFLDCIIELIEWKKENKNADNVKIASCWFVFLLHVFFGFVWFFRILVTHVYW